MKKSILFFIAVSILSFNLMEGYFPKFKTEIEATQYLCDHYNKGVKAYKEKRWRKAIFCFKEVIRVFPEMEEATLARFYLGICYLELGDYEFANVEFNAYLRSLTQPEFFEETIDYKFQIAEAFKSGVKCHMTGFNTPKIFCGKMLAIEIYDEIIQAVPNSEVAAYALNSKGILLQEIELYRESVETFQTLIRRFPKSELTPMAYVLIAKSYYLQSCIERQNPDILALAEINARNFRAEFPKDEASREIDRYTGQIKERFAQGLYETGRFYERKNQPQAAMVYYRTAVYQYPDTHLAKFCRKRMELIDKAVDEFLSTNPDLSDCNE